jgi:hypothetical protein
MSWVTNIILSTSILDADKSADLNAAIRQPYKDPFGALMVISRDDAGGDKQLEATIYLAAFNRLNLERFLTAVRAVPWDDPEELQLFIKGEDDERFSEIELGMLEAIDRGDL